MQIDLGESPDLVDKADAYYALDTAWMGFETTYYGAIASETDDLDNTLNDLVHDHEEDLIEAAEEYWTTSVTIGVEVEKTLLKADFGFAGAYNKAADDFSQEINKAAKSFDGSAVSASETRVSDDEDSESSFIGGALDLLFSTIDTAYLDASGAFGTLLNSDKDDIQDYYLAEEYEVGGLITDLIGDAFGAVSSAVSTIYDMADDGLVALNSFASKLLNTSNTIEKSAIKEAEALARREIQSRVTYLNAISDADWSERDREIDRTALYRQQRTDYGLAAASDFIQKTHEGAVADPPLNTPGGLILNDYVTPGSSAVFVPSCMLFLPSDFDPDENDPTPDWGFGAIGDSIYAGFGGVSLINNMYDSSSQTTNYELGASSDGYGPLDFGTEEDSGTEMGHGWAFDAFQDYYNLLGDRNDDHIAADRQSAASTYAASYYDIFNDAGIDAEGFVTSYLSSDLGGMQGFSGDLITALSDANSSFASDAVTYDPTSDVIDYAKASAGNGRGLLSGLGENFGDFQVDWRTEDQADDLDWATDAADARDAYLDKIYGTSGASENFTNSFYGGIQNYSNTMRDAGIALSNGFFAADTGYASASLATDSTWIQGRFGADSNQRLDYLDAAVEEAKLYAAKEATEAQELADASQDVVDDAEALITPRMDDLLWIAPAPGLTGLPSVDTTLTGVRYQNYILKTNGVLEEVGSPGVTIKTIASGSDIDAALLGYTWLDFETWVGGIDNSANEPLAYEGARPDLESVSGIYGDEAVGTLDPPVDPARVTRAEASAAVLLAYEATLQVDREADEAVSDVDHKKKSNDADNAFVLSAMTDATAAINGYAGSIEDWTDVAKPAEKSFVSTVVAAASSFTDEACRLGGLFLDAIGLVSAGGTVDTSTFFDSGSSSEYANICFAKGTPVLMANGTTLAIEEVRAGDQVWAAQHDSPQSEPTPCRVARTFANDPASVIELTFSCGRSPDRATDQTLTILATPSHPFYINGIGWTPAENLTIDMQAVARDGSTLTLTQSRLIASPQPVFNLEVETAHTYYVGTSEQNSVLVHNTCEDPSPLASPLLQFQDSTPFAWTSPSDFQPDADWAVSDVDYPTVPAPVTMTYTDANEGETVCVYSPDGDLISLTDSLDNETTWTYDGSGRAVSETNELGFTRYYEYDSDGNLTKHTDRRGVEITYTLDTFGNVITETWPDRVIEYEYNRYGDLLSVDDAKTDYLYAYDDYGRLLKEAVVTDDGTTEFIYRYDRYGQVATVTAFIDGVEDFTNAYQYDFEGRIIDLEQTGPDVISKHVTFDYTADSLIIKRFEDGALVIESTTEYNSSRPGHDSALEMLDISNIAGVSHVDASGNVLASHGYTHDENGLVDTYANEDGSVEYSYDSEGQIVSADYDYQANETFTYDANGNRLAYTVGPNNQVLYDGVYFYAYDQSGNRTEKYQWTDANADGLVDADERSDLTEYSWDARSRLANITTKPDGVTTSKDVAYSYDYLNRRTEKLIEVTDTFGSTETTESYSYLGHDIVLQQNDGELSHRYLHGDIIDHCLADEQLFEENGIETSNVLLPLFDNLGSVRDLVDYDDVLAVSSVVNHLAYNSFGSIVLETGPTYTCIYGFTGRETDIESDGLLFYRGRYYDSDLSVFISNDPISFDADDTNLYRYVGNSPTNYTDPTGLEIDFVEPWPNMRFPGMVLTNLERERIYNALLVLATEGGDVGRILAYRALSNQSVGGIKVRFFHMTSPSAQYQSPNIDVNALGLWLEKGPGAFLSPGDYTEVPDLQVLIDAIDTDKADAVVLGHELGHIIGFRDPTVKQPLCGNVTIIEDPLRKALEFPPRMFYCHVHPDPDRDTIHNTPIPSMDDYLAQFNSSERGILSSFRDEFFDPDTHERADARAISAWDRSVTLVNYDRAVAYQKVLQILRKEVSFDDITWLDAEQKEEMTTLGSTLWGWNEAGDIESMEELAAKVSEMNSDIQANLLFHNGNYYTLEEYIKIQIAILNGN